jgi:hypothetical protein
VGAPATLLSGSRLVWTAARIMIYPDRSYLV